MSVPSGGEAFRRNRRRRYFRVALFYLSLGLLLGAGMLWFGNDNFQFLHSHMLLVEWGSSPAYGAGPPVDRRAVGRFTAARRHAGSRQRAVLARQRRSSRHAAGSVLAGRAGAGPDRRPLRVHRSGRGHPLRPFSFPGRSGKGSGGFGNGVDLPFCREHYWEKGHSPP